MKENEEPLTEILSLQIIEKCEEASSMLEY